MAHRHSQSANGFTLIELMISVGLMAGILITAYACLEAGLSVRGLVEQRTSALQQARTALKLISADLKAATPMRGESPFLGISRMLEEIEADNVDFATHHYRPVRPNEGDFCEVSYYLDQSPLGPGLSLWRRRDPSPDPLPLEGGTKEEIAEGILGFHVEYYDGYEWYDAWGSEGQRQSLAPGAESTVTGFGNLSGVPEAVRIGLSIRDSAVRFEAGSTEKDAKEVPIVLRTVVRLNLAPTYWNQTLSASSGFEGGSSNPSTPGGR